MAVTSRRTVATTGMATIVVNRRPPRHAGRYPRAGSGVRRRPLCGSAADGFEDEAGGFGAGEVLLAGDEVAVADGERAECACLDVVGPELADFVLDAPRHDVGALGQRARLPGHPVGGVFLDVGQA